MKKLGFTLLAVALSVPFMFAAPAQAQASSTSQPAGKTTKHKVKHHKKHGSKTARSNSAQPMAK